MGADCRAAAQATAALLVECRAKLGASAPS